MEHFQERRRIRYVLDDVLEHESKVERDAILTEYDDNQIAAVRHCMTGIAQRLATMVEHSGAGLMFDARRKVRRERLAEIRQPWLRDRVATMVRERFEAKRTRRVA